MGFLLSSSRSRSFFRLCCLPLLVLLTGCDYPVVVDGTVTKADGTPAAGVRGTIKCGILGPVASVLSPSDAQGHFSGEFIFKEKRSDMDGCRSPILIAEGYQQPFPGKREGVPEMDTRWLAIGGSGGFGGTQKIIKVKMAFTVTTPNTETNTTEKTYLGNGKPITDGGPVPASVGAPVVDEKPAGDAH